MCNIFSFLPTKISQEKLRTNIWKIQSKRLDKFRHNCGPHLQLVQSSQALEQQFYENYPSLDSCDPFTRQSSIKVAFKTFIRSHSVAYGSTKIEFLIFQNNRVFFASAFLSVQFKSNTEYCVNFVFQSIRTPYFPIFHVFRHSAEQGHPNVGEDMA